MIQLDMVDLLAIFDAILPMSDEQLAIYYLERRREDGIVVHLSFNTYEGGADVLVVGADGTGYASVYFNQCSSI